MILFIIFYQTEQNIKHKLHSILPYNYPNNRGRDLKLGTRGFLREICQMVYGEGRFGFGHFYPFLFGYAIYD